MPIYEYRCSSCSNEFEVLIREEADVPSGCPECGRDHPQRILSAFSAVSRSTSVPVCGQAAAADCPSGSCPYA